MDDSAAVVCLKSGSRIRVSILALKSGNLVLCPELRQTDVHLPALGVTFVNGELNRRSGKVLQRTFRNLLFRNLLTY
jgi:hypothetical protein